MLHETQVDRTNEQAFAQRLMAHYPLEVTLTQTKSKIDMVITQRVTNVLHSFGEYKRRYNQSTDFRAMLTIDQSKIELLLDVGKGLGGKAMLFIEWNDFTGALEITDENIKTFKVTKQTLHRTRDPGDIQEDVVNIPTNLFKKLF